MGRNFLWLNKPDFMKPSGPKVPEKYRITIDCTGYNVDSIKTELSKDKSKLIVTGREGHKNHGDEDYYLNEFKKTYNLPKNAESEKMVSFLTSNGQLIIEVPLKLDEAKSNERSEDFFPRIVDSENGRKNVEMSLFIPNNIDPSKVKITCKDRDLIIQAEDRVEKPDGMSQMSYYRRTTLPENTDFNSLKCLFGENKLSIKAPLNMDFNGSCRTIPIEMSKSHK